MRSQRGPAKNARATLVTRVGPFALLLGITLTACGAFPGSVTPGQTSTPSPTSTLGFVEQIEAVPGVESVSLGDPETVVTVRAAASDAEVVAAAEATNSVARATGLTGSVTLARTDTEGASGDRPDAASPDAVQPTSWRVTVHPAEQAAAAERVAGVLAVEDVAGASDVAVLGDGWPYVTIDPAADVAAVFAELAATDLFADGGTYTEGTGEHLQIVHVPTRTTVEAIQRIIRIAKDYPTAEFQLQATTEGPQWPQLLVANIDAAEGETLEARLRDPALADADPDGLPQPFQLTVIGAEGPTYVAGTLGDVPRP